MTPILEVKNIHKNYANHVALKDVSLSIEPQKIFGLLGPNGAGKTSLIRIINQITGPDSGEVWFDGERLAPKHVDFIGYLPEERGLYKKMRIVDQLRYFAALKNLNAKSADRAIDFWLDRVELSDWKMKNAIDLSKGMQQKIQFVSAVMHDPDLIILDEPFSGLDPNNLTNVIKLLTNVANQHTINTFVIVTHDVTSALIISDHVYLLGETEPGRGARIVKEYDLIAENLAYHAEIEDMPRFLEIRKEIKYVEFPKLVIKKQQ